MKIKIDVPNDVIKAFVDHFLDGEIFNLHHGSGYWLRSVSSFNNGILAHQYYEKSISDKKDQKAKRAYAKGVALPPDYYRVDYEAAIRAFTEGIKRFGLQATIEADLPKMDVMVQLALLGEYKYG